MATPIWVPNTSITVPVNLRYLDANGDTVNSLYPLPYLVLVGQDLNVAMSDIDALQICCSGNTSQIASLTAAVATIPPEYTTPTIYTQCLTPSGSTVLPIDEVLDMLVTNWCSYINVNGSQSALATAIATQCTNLNAGRSFGTPGTSMSAITGWRTSPTTIADAIANLWYTACDSRAGIITALDAITPTCAQVIVDYQVALTSSNTVFSFYFNSYSFIPAGYADNGSLIKIVDASGNQYLQSLDIVDQSTTAGPLDISISGTTLLTDSSYTITVTSNVVNSAIGQTCIKTVIKNIPPSTTNTSCCPDIVNYSVSASGSTTLAVVTGLSYLPSFVAMTPKNSFTSGLLGDQNYSPYLNYVYGGCNLIFTLPPSGDINLDLAVYR